MRNPEHLLAKQPLFNQHVRLQTHHLSTYHFSSIFLWQDFFEFEFELIEDSLCIFARQKGSCFLYLPPLSVAHKHAVVETCFAKMNKVNPRTARIENIEQNHLDFFEGSFKVYSKLEEYVYEKQALMELKGQAYKSQRHDIHHFQAHQEALFRPYEQTDLKACLSLYESWAKSRHDKHEDDVYRCMLQENRITHELAFIYHEALGLNGYVVEVEGKIAAYSFGYSLNCDTFCVLLEIIDINTTGLAAFIFNRVCSEEKLRPYRFINTMDDFGMPFVAASKQAYHPTKRPVSHTITLKNPA